MEDPNLGIELYNSLRSLVSNISRALSIENRAVLSAWNISRDVRFFTTTSIKEAVCSSPNWQWEIIPRCVENKDPPLYYTSAKRPFWLISENSLNRGFRFNKQTNTVWIRINATPSNKRRTCSKEWGVYLRILRKSSVQLGNLHHPDIYDSISANEGDIGEPFNYIIFTNDSVY